MTSGKDAGLSPGQPRIEVLGLEVPARDDAELVDVGVGGSQGVGPAFGDQTVVVDQAQQVAVSMLEKPVDRLTDEPVLRRVMETVGPRGDPAWS